MFTQTVDRVHLDYRSTLSYSLPHLNHTHTWSSETEHPEEPCGASFSGVWLAEESRNINSREKVNPLKEEAKKARAAFLSTQLPLPQA